MRNLKIMINDNADLLVTVSKKNTEELKKKEQQTIKSNAEGSQGPNEFKEEEKENVVMFIMRNKNEGREIEYDIKESH